MKNNIQILMGISLSLLITFTFHSVLNGKRAMNSVFQHIIADTFHYAYLFARCSIIEGVNTFSPFGLSLNDKINMIITVICSIVFFLIVWWYGLKVLNYFLLGILTILSVWLLARWCVDFHICYSIDIFTIYLLIWQFTYLIWQWCFHKLSWPNLIFYQLSICLLSSIAAFIFYDLFLRYFPLIHILVHWICSIEDIFQCFYINGRYRNQYKESSMNYLMERYPTFPPFCYYTQDFENGIDKSKYWAVLGGGDLFIYNLLLLWILSPLSSIITQFYILIIFIINIEISLRITCWLGSIWKESLMPATPVPIILISAYSIILHFIVQLSLALTIIITTLLIMIMFAFKFFILLGTQNVNKNKH